MVEVRIPAPHGPLVNPKTGQVTREWWRFFHDLLERTGGTGDVIIEVAGGDLEAIEALTGTGLCTRIGNETWTLRDIAAGNGISVTNSDGVSGNPTLAADVVSVAAGGGAFVTDSSGAITVEAAFQVFEVTVGQGDVASAASKILLNATSGETWKILDIVLSADGTNFSGGGGDRLLSITDGTSIWSIIPAATLQSLAVSRWGVDAGMPNPSTASHLFAESASGTDIVAKYSGGTTDYTTGSLTLRITAYRTA